MADKIIYGMYDDDHTLLEGAKKLVGKGVHVSDVFSPFPIHGIDPVIGVKQTRLAICAFLYGLTGLALALVAINYFMIRNWPMNIGGKPSFSMMENLPAFIPICFEFTVLCAAHGMAITYLLRNKTLPGMKAKNPDPRTTDDKFVMELRATENSQFSEEDLKNMLKETGTIELSEKELN